MLMRRSDHYHYCSFSCHQSIKIRHAGETDFTKNYCLLYGKSGNLRGNAIINAHTHCFECVSIRFEMQPNRPSLLHCMRKRCFRLSFFCFTIKFIYCSVHN